MPDLDGFEVCRRLKTNPATHHIPVIMVTAHHHVKQHEVASARAQIASACSPLIAVITSKYSADSRASSSLTLAATSSTTRTRAVFTLSGHAGMG